MKIEEGFNNYMDHPILKNLINAKFLIYLIKK